MTCVYRRINFSKVEIYMHLLINYSTRNLLQKLENCEKKNGINFANEANQNISRSQTLAKTVKISAPKWKNYNFRKFLVYYCIFWISIKNVWDHFKNLLRITRLKENFAILIEKKQCMHCFLQHVQGCMWRIRVIHLWRPHRGSKKIG